MHFCRTGKTSLIAFYLLFFAYQTFFTKSVELCCKLQETLYRVTAPLDEIIRFVHSVSVLESNGMNKFAADALAGLAAKEDVSKITLKKTSKSRAGVSQEKSEYDGTAPVMLLQIKGE